MASGVLFDVDGTLVDTTYLHAVSWWQALRQFDHDVPIAKIHRAIGMGSDKILDALLGPDRDRDSDADAKAAHSALYAQYRDLLRETARRLQRPGRAEGQPRPAAGRGGAAPALAVGRYGTPRRTLRSERPPRRGSGQALGRQ